MAFYEGVLANCCAGCFCDAARACDGGRAANILENNATRKAPNANKFPAARELSLQLLINPWSRLLLLESALIRMANFVYAFDPTVLSLGGPVRAVCRRMPLDIAREIAMFIPRDRNFRAPTAALISTLAFEADHWEPESIYVYSYMGDTFRIPMDQPGRIEVVFGQLFRFQATIRERERAWFRLADREG